MAVYFLDTSAVVKRYVQEIGTAWLRNLTDSQSSHVLFILQLTEVELTAALARRRKGLSLGAGQAQMALNQFRLEMVQHYRVVEVTVPLVNHATQLADRYALRAYDAVQFAAALEIRSLAPTMTLLSADDELNTAATAEGLPVDDPNTHP